MAVNRDNPCQWKLDIAQSVDLYNDWFMRFAPEAYRTTRLQTTKDVEATLAATSNLTDIRVRLLREHPEVLPTLRMCTCPPLAVDRLIGLAGVSPNLVRSMEKEKKLPPRMDEVAIEADLQKVSGTIQRMTDPDIFVWLGRNSSPTTREVRRAATVVADRLCGAVANPIVRNAQEQRQLTAIAEWLRARGYARLPAGAKSSLDAMPPGSFGFRVNVPVMLNGGKHVNIPVDVAIVPKAGDRPMPILVEAKSAGDFTNVNKRRKEEAAKMAQLSSTYGQRVTYVLFLCGYFDTGYLGYEAAEGIDWVWEHRIDDFAQLGL